ncbi:MAG: HEAT repeat domain-containing protein, partial [Pyrinomonadaceae bacterium]
PKAAGSKVKHLPRGMKVREVGSSLEVLVPVKPGANVTVEPRFNHLDLVVDGQLDTTQKAGEDQAQSEKTRTVVLEEESAHETAASTRTPRERHNENVSSAVSSSSTSAPTAARQTADTPLLQHAPATSDGVQVAQNMQPPVSSSSAVTTPANADEDEGGIISFVFSLKGLVIAMLLFLGFLFYRKYKNSHGFEDVEEKVSSNEAEAFTKEKMALEIAEPHEMARTGSLERRKKLRRTSDQQAAQLQANAENMAQALALRQPVAVNVHGELFGAYRVDQEVGKLVLGQAHRMDVLSSRAPDDRRAIETSLIKSINSPDEKVRERARGALVEYGFVARQSAALLMSPDAYERATAARVLGEIGSPTSLPFMLEALYDGEQIVRNQAVAGLGQLKLPAAIGPLLDIARRHPEIPQSILSRALNACSVDFLDIGDAPQEISGALPPAGGSKAFTGEITLLEPLERIEELPEWLEDEKLSDALNMLEDVDVEARLAAARSLAQFQVRSSVEALSAMAARDTEAVVRAAAIASLCTINHESVFTAVLFALGDEAKEVSAAAARALTRLSFDRADAYVRVMETADEETLTNVARSCIKAGISKQAIDRLASEDRRQAYEAFSLLSLLARAGETEPIIEAIVSHPDMNARLSAIRLLGLSCRPHVGQQLRQLVVRDGLPEKVRGALLEVVYKLDQAQPV